MVWGPGLIVDELPRGVVMCRELEVWAERPVERMICV